MYVTKISSPVGNLLLASDGQALTGLWLEGQKYFTASLGSDTAEQPELPVFRQTAEWLNAYFERSPLPALPPLAPQGSVFRQAVWKLLQEIPYGQTTTYGELARRLLENGIPAAPQAVGGAVGHNPISILIPCHRVLGADGSLTGYAGGIAAKRYLLQLEGVDTTGLSSPSTAFPKERRKKFLYLPKSRSLEGPGTLSPATVSQLAAGQYPCPCCDCRTFPMPAAGVLAYICPVCMWENNLFTTSDDEPSDENHGLTLNQGRENYKTLGVCDSRLARYARKPLPEELP